MVEEIETTPLNKMTIDIYKKDIYNAAVAYNNFVTSIKDKTEIDNVFIISKEYINFFKEKINYDEKKEYYEVKDDDSNYENFEKEKLKNYTFNELEEIVFKEFKIYGDLDDLEADINKGFEFVTKKFLDSLEVEFNDEDYKVKYMQDSNNIIIKFKDDSKLIIFTDKNNQKKYHAIPAPVISAQDKSQFKRTSTICISRRKKGNTVLVQRKSNAI